MKYFGEPDADENGGPSDADEDDQNQLSGVGKQPAFATGGLAGATGGSDARRSQLGGVGLTGDTRGQAQLDDDVPAPPSAPSSAFASTGGKPPAPGAAPAKVAGVTAALTKPTAATGPSIGPSTSSAPAAAAGKAAGTGAMAWLGPIASALAAHQQEKQMRNDAAARIAMQYGQSQGNFPAYGYEAAQANRRINDRLGGPGLSGLFGRLAGR